MRNSLYKLVQGIVCIGVGLGLWVSGRWMVGRFEQSKKREREIQRIVETGIIPRTEEMRERASEQAGEPPSRAALNPEVPMDRDDLYQQAARLAKEDPEGGYEWSCSLPDQKSQVDFLLFLGMALSDQKVFLIKDWIDKIPPGAEQNRLLERLGAVWMNQNAENALQWASHVQGAAYGPQIVYEFMNVWAVDHPQQAAQYAIKKLPIKLQDRALEIVFDRWVLREGDGALNELDEWSDGAIKEHLAQRVFGALAQNNITQLSEWLNAHPSGKMRDLGVRILVAEIANEDPELAKKWASTLHQ